MATRLNLRQQDTVRAHIQATQLVHRLQACAMGEVELTQAQLKSIEILLRKSLPDLSSVEVTGDPDNPLTSSLLVKFGN